MHKTNLEKLASDNPRISDSDININLVWFELVFCANNLTQIKKFFLHPFNLMMSECSVACNWTDRCLKKSSYLAPVKCLMCVLSCYVDWVGGISVLWGRGGDTEYLDHDDGSGRQRHQNTDVTYWALSWYTFRSKHEICQHFFLCFTSQWWCTTK